MTQFGSPPPPPAYAPAYPERSSAPPWSASAIGAFVLSLLGWIGITAILGLIFGVVGILATRDGKRRGRGLAIAAIPVSIVTGTVAVFIAFVFMLFLRMAEVPKKMEAVLGGSDVAAQVESLRQLTSAEWNQTVGDEAIRTWLADVRTKYGAMTAMKVDVSKGVSVSQDNQAPQVAVNARFVNGNAVLRFTFDAKDPWSARLSDVEIDGVSPRKATESEPGADKMP